MKAPLKNKFPWYVAGLHFECVGCGRCCCGPEEGCIWITMPEIKLLADFLDIPIKNLRIKYLKRVGPRTTIIEERFSKDCIFLKDIDGRKQCSIYPVRPNQCRTWPFWSENLTSPSAWNQTAQKCPGISRGRLYNCEEIEKIRMSKKWWPDDK